MTEPSPMWRAIAGEIEAEIKARRLNPGDRLPTEHALARRFVVNRYTVRRALAHLQAKGLVETNQGRGSFVRRPALPYYIHRRTRFSENIRHLAATHRNDTLALDMRPADAQVAEALGLRYGDPVVYLERLGVVNDQPVSISRHYFSHARLPMFAAMYPSRGSITATLRDSGILDYVRVRTRVLARLPNPQECDLLALPKHVPLIMTQSINQDGLGAPLEFGDARFAADRVEFVIEPEPAPAQDEAVSWQGAGKSC